MSKDTTSATTFELAVDQNYIPVCYNLDGSLVLLPDGNKLPKDAFFKDLYLGDLNDDYKLVAARRKLAKITYLKYMSAWYAAEAKSVEEGIRTPANESVKIENKILNLLVKKFGGDKEKAQAAYDAMMG